MIDLRKTITNTKYLRQADIAKGMGISRQMVSHYVINGIKNPKKNQEFKEFFKQNKIKPFDISQK